MTANPTIANKKILAGDKKNKIKIKEAESYPSISMDMMAHSLNDEM